MTGILFSIMQQETPQVCLIDVTAPVGGAISSLTNNPDGSLRASWPAAVDISNPIRYEVYVKRASNTDLFNAANIVAVIYGLTFDIFKDAQNLAISKGETYHVGVVAVDGVGNRNENTTSLSIVALGLEYYNLINAFYTPACQNIEVTINQERLEIEIEDRSQIEIEIDC
jgi:hypothetical protein